MKRIIEIKYGSHLYGTDTENSDLDLKGVFLPTKEQLLSGRHPRNIQGKRAKLHGEKNTKDDIDLEMISLDRFVELLSEGQTMALDMLFAPRSSFTPGGLTSYQLAEGRIWDVLIENRERFLTKNVSAFVGYARKQAAKYGVKGSRLAAVREVLELLKSVSPQSRISEHEKLIDALIESTKGYISIEKTPLVEIVELPALKEGQPQKYLSCCGRKTPFTNKVIDAIKIYQRVFDEYGARALQAESNNGIDWKALSHAVRVNSEAVELLETGHITLPLPNKELVLAIKKGEIPYRDVAKMIEQGLVDLERARATSTLRDAPDKEWASTFVSREYSAICGKDWPPLPSALQRVGHGFMKIIRATPLLMIMRPLFKRFRHLRYILRIKFTKGRSGRKIKK